MDEKEGDFVEKSFTQRFICIPDDHERARVHFIDDGFQPRNFCPCNDNIAAYHLGQIGLIAGAISQFG